MVAQECSFPSLNSQTIYNLQVTIKVFDYTYSVILFSICFYYSLFYMVSVIYPDHE